MTRNVPADLLTQEQREFLDGISTRILKSYIRARVNREIKRPPNRKCGHKYFVEGCPRCKRAQYLKSKQAAALVQ